MAPWPLLYTDIASSVVAPIPSTVAGCAPATRSAAYASAVANAKMTSTKNATGRVPALKTMIAKIPIASPVSVAFTMLLCALALRTARPASGLSVIVRLVR